MVHYLQKTVHEPIQNCLPDLMAYLTGANNLSKQMAGLIDGFIRPSQRVPQLRPF